jgi:hypothetical protein
MQTVPKGIKMTNPNYLMANVRAVICRVFVVLAQVCRMVITVEQHV